MEHKPLLEVANIRKPEHKAEVVKIHLSKENPTPHNPYSLSNWKSLNTHHHYSIKAQPHIFSLPSNPLPIHCSHTPNYSISSLLFRFTYPLILLLVRAIMATCGGLRSLFENPLPENPTLLESLSSWNHHKSMKPIEVSSFSEIFGELYFQEKPESPATIPPVPTPPPLLAPALAQAPQSNIPELDSKTVQAPENHSLDSILGLPKNRYRCDPKGNGGFSAKNLESLQLCTEGLGSESSDDVDDLMDSGDDWRSCGKGELVTGRRQLMYNRVDGYSKCCWDVKSSKSEKQFPPPISSIGKSGKPWVCLKSYREDGRFVLREIRIPSQELLHASREDGRLKLHFVHPDEDIVEGEEDEEGDDDDDGEQDEKGEQGEGGETKEDGKKLWNEGSPCSQTQASSAGTSWGDGGQLPREDRCLFSCLGLIQENGLRVILKWAKAQDETGTATPGLRAAIAKVG